MHTRSRAFRFFCTVVLVATAVPALAGGLLDLVPVQGRNSGVMAIAEGGLIVGNWQLPDTTSQGFLYSSGVLTELPFPVSGFLVDPINNAGQIVGDGPSSVTPGETHALLYDAGVVTDLGTLGGDSSSVLGVNEAGQVGGNSTVPGGATHGFLYSGGAMTDLGTLGGSYSGAAAMNDAGHMAGDSQVTDDTDVHMFFWSEGVMTDLGKFGTGRATIVTMNNSDTIAGFGRVNGPYEPYALHSFLHCGGAFTDIGTLGGLSTLVYDLNNAGQAVGVSDSAMGPRAFLYSGGTLTNLGTLGGYESRAYAINELGQVVGQSRTTSGDWHGFLYTDGVMHDLGTLGGAESSAGPISDDGIVVGSAQTASGDWHAFMLACPVLPLAGCNLGSRSSLQITDDEIDRKDRLTWKWSKGLAVSQSTLGDPSGATDYTLCIYDSTAGTDHLVGSVHVDPGTAWTDANPKGWSFADTGAEDGVQKMTLRTGADGKPKAQILARGAALPLPSPFSETAYFDLDGRVVVQLINNTTPLCLESRFPAAVKNDAIRFKASSR